MFEAFGKNKKRNQMSGKEKKKGGGEKQKIRGKTVNF